MDTIETAVAVPTIAGTPFAGGIYAGRFFIGNQPFALIVAPADIGELASTKWGGLKAVAGACSYNDGLANTLAMVAAGSPLGKWAVNLKIGGAEDWYLPSRLEALIAFGEARAVAEFEQDWYWTSTQDAGDAGCAWYQIFGYGDQNGSSKSASLRARAVRRFPIQ